MTEQHTASIRIDPDVKPDRHSVVLTLYKGPDKVSEQSFNDLSLLGARALARDLKRAIEKSGRYNGS